MSQQPTKTIRTVTRPEPPWDAGRVGTITETTETEAKFSVELKELAKGGIQVESVKVYADTEQEAGDRALTEMLRLRAKIKDAAEAETHRQLEASTKGLKP